MMCLKKLLFIFLFVFCSSVQALYCQNTDTQILENQRAILSILPQLIESASLREADSLKREQISNEREAFLTEREVSTTKRESELEQIDKDMQKLKEDVRIQSELLRKEAKISKIKTYGIAGLLLVCLVETFIIILK